MEHNDQLHVEAEEALANINKKTGRNMPQAVATGAVLVIIILASLLIRIDVFVLLIVVFMVLALWELRVDFATVGLHIPVVALWLCSAAILLGTYYSPYHFGTMALLTMATLMLVAILATARFSFGNWLSLAVASSCRAPTPPRAGSRRSIMRRRTASQSAVACRCLDTHRAVHPYAGQLHRAVAGVQRASGRARDHAGIPAGPERYRRPVLRRMVRQAQAVAAHLPKKSVEGLFGSILFAMIGAFAVFFCTYDGAVWASRWWVPIVMGVLTGVAGTFGDLCASMLKRDIGIKDMGHLLKGHGGVMDRVDSILMCAPFLAGLLWIVGM